MQARALHARQGNVGCQARQGKAGQGKVRQAFRPTLLDWVHGFPIYDVGGRMGEGRNGTQARPITLLITNQESDVDTGEAMGKKLGRPPIPLILLTTQDNRQKHLTSRLIKC